MNIRISDISYNIVYSIAQVPHLYVIIGIILLLLTSGIALYPLISDKFNSIKQYDSIFNLCMALTIIYYKLPFLSYLEQNVDESEEIAAAMTLAVDPVYWRSVALGTHGPLSTYPLLIPHLFGFRIDYGAAKFMVVMMIIISQFCMRSFFARLYSHKLSQLAVLPTMIFFCLSNADDYVAYNAEFPVAMVTSIAILLIGILIQSTDNISAKNIYLCGFVLGCAPFVKIQSAPIVLALLLFAIVVVSRKNTDIHRKIKNLLVFAGGGITVSIIFGAMIWYFNLYHDFKIRYLEGQANYAKLNHHPIIDIVTIFLASFKQADIDSGHFYSLSMISAMVIILIMIIAKYKHTTVQNRNSGIYVIVFLALVTAMSMLSVTVPGKGYEHYYVLIVYPLAFMSGALFLAANQQKINKACILLYIAISIVTPLIYLKSALFDDLSIDKTPQTSQSTDQIITSTIKKYTKPGEKMVIWGWADKYYVYTRLIRGCRTEFISYIHDVYGNQEYYLNSFYNELKSSNAPVLLDTIAPNQLAFNDRATYGFENYPDISKYIYDHYRCIKDVDGNRIFINNTRLN